MRNEVEKLIELDAEVQLAKCFLKDAENRFKTQCANVLNASLRVNEIGNPCREFVINVGGMRYLVTIDSGWPTLDIKPEQAISIRPVKFL